MSVWRPGGARRIRDAGALGLAVLLVAVAADARVTPRLAAGLRAAVPAGSVQVYVGVAGAARAALEAVGLVVELESLELGLVQGRIAPDRIAQLAAVPGVVSVRPADRARRRAVVSEGDAAARAGRARALGFDGSGVVVGVLSDGIDGLAAAQALGELPAVTVPADPRCPAGGGDEGTAVLEIVHDVAPGATLLFAGPSTSLEFIEAARCLADAGARVIVDDLGFYLEPFFEDGPVARAVRNVAARGIVWVSAAGNDALQHFDEGFRVEACPGLHDFGYSCTNRVWVAPGDVLECVLQWNDPFGGAGNDYDLVLVDETYATIQTSADPQTGADDPIETVVWENAGDSERQLGLRIRLVNGQPRRLKLFCQGGWLERIVARGSIVGHPAVREALAVGAIDVTDPLLREVEPFSSRGPTELYFPVEAREKPDLAGFDAVSVSTPGFTPFYGTSAAAPHVAGVAALVLAKHPFLTADRVRDLLRASAVDLPPPGADLAYGAGRLDALLALEATPSPECRIDFDCDPAGACPLDACGGGICAESGVRGVGIEACATSRLPRRIARRFTGACRQAARAAGAPSGSAARRGRRASGALAAAERALERARRHGVAAACADAVAAHLAAARARLAPVGTR